MGTLLYFAGAIGTFVCWIMVLIKMFKTEKPLLGVLGILCWIWTFIWGWMNSTKQGLKKIMLIWTASMILMVVGAVLGGGGSFSYQVGTPPPASN